MAGRDIRRLVAVASLRSSQEKVLTGRRLLAGMAAVPESEVVMVDDREGLGAYLAADAPLPVRLIEEGHAEGAGRTVEWVARLEQAGISVLVAVGGDGTQRLVASARPRVPLIPVAGGTNNVACWLGDETAAGLAAARYAQQGMPLEDVGRRHKWIRLQVGAVEEVALIDLAWVRRAYTGALAVWEPEAVAALLLTTADATRPGLSNIGGQLEALSAEEDAALWLELGEAGQGREVAAILAPGLMARFAVRRRERIPLGAWVEQVAEADMTLALDGERELVVASGARVRVAVERSGLWVLDPARVLTWAAPA